MQAWKAWFNETNNDLTINVIGEITSTPNFDLCLTPRYPKVLNTSIWAFDVIETKSESPSLKQPRLVHFCQRVKDVTECTEVQVFYKGELITHLKDFEVVCQQVEAEATLL